MPFAKAHVVSDYQQRGMIAIHGVREASRDRVRFSIARDSGRHHANLRISSFYVGRNIWDAMGRPPAFAILLGEGADAGKIALQGHAIIGGRDTAPGRVANYSVSRVHVHQHSVACKFSPRAVVEYLARHGLPGPDGHVRVRTVDFEHDKAHGLLIVTLPTPAEIEADKVRKRAAPARDQNTGETAPNWDWTDVREDHEDADARPSDTEPVKPAANAETKPGRFPPAWLTGRGD